MRFLPNCDVVVSATASPNFTLRDELFQDVASGKTAPASWILQFRETLNRLLAAGTELRFMIWTASVQKDFHRKQMRVLSKQLQL